jgi:hypothetical protein
LAACSLLWDLHSRKQTVKMNTTWNNNKHNKHIYSH